MRTGIANLPLHTGKCPRWLFSSMVKLAGAVCCVVVDEYGQKELLRRLSDPFWFQGFGCVLAFDWHSSGLTTTVCGALKEALKNEGLGVFAAGGKGAASRKAPQEIADANLSDSKIKRLAYASKIAAKVDSCMVQDGYQLYHHSFVFNENGDYAVIQQGMNKMNRYARRYHWLSDTVTEFVEEPHAAICCDTSTETLDLTARESRETREISVELVRDNPEHIFRFFGGGQRLLGEFFGQQEKALHMPARHWIWDIDLTVRDRGILKKAYELQPQNYEELVSFSGIGAKKLRALALVSDLIYGSNTSWKDPVKYSFSHGGKDGTPFPVERDVYEHSIDVLRTAVESARIGQEDKLRALRRLQEYAKV